jgi:hypothetical protein
MLDSAFRRAFVALCTATTLLVVSAGCSLDTADPGRGEQSGAVRGGSKGWKPSTAPDAGSSANKTDAAPAQASSQVRPSDASVGDARARNDDELDAGDSTKPTNTNPLPTAGSGACMSGGGAKTEICNTIDDDCDKKVDEDCECPSAEPVACYDGPSGTLDLGNCRAGTRSCAAGMLGPCLGAVLPSVETCNEIDDDCNGQVDDLPSLVEDKENCGRCGVVCGRSESCCNGRCVNPRGEDAQNCGACGTVCTEGSLPGCCGGRCVDLLSDPTCGNCDNACGLLRLGGGFVCSCRMTEVDGPQCVAQMDNSEWLCQ